ncbi:carbohydrate binding domain-containing protein [Microbacterium sp. H1-D42]|uniref:carbohydrate binding domain-containing protein n=1 Tax=Microbacterium sp. H1-D42 TaxID=2925844 RepID=UPI001F52F99F|nr:carbohydrate binding domain-containing protein [Microbacterium sp. H1-D42]UNK70708.1 carbohydrate binding domain-containing protein [Microbacterium sp. H1-D42]
MIPRSRTLVGVAAAALIVTTLANPLQTDESAVAATDPDANLLVDASFESGATLAELDGWAPWSTRSSDYFKVSTSNTTVGAQSLHVDDTSTSYGGGVISTAMPVEERTAYEVNLEVYKVSGSFSVWTYFLDDSGTQLASSWQTVRTEEDKWERAFLDFDSPAGAAQAQIMIYAGNAPVVDAYLDDVYFGLKGESGHERPVPPSVPDLVVANDPNLTYTGTPVGSRITKNAVIGQEGGVWMSYGVFKGVESTGYPATLVVARLDDGEIVRRVPLPGSGFAQEIRRSSDGRIYVATDGDYSLWVYDPETTKARRIGVINPSTPADGYTWSMAAGHDGEMYLGTYPKGLLFRYDPVTDVIANLGAVDSSQKYIHGLAFDQERGYLYVGAGGSSAQIWKVAPDGTKTALLNEQTAPGSTTESFASTFTFVDDRLFARISNQIIVIGADDQVQYWKGDGPEMHGYWVTPRPDQPEHYIYVFGRTFWEFDATNGTRRDLGIPANGYLNDGYWVESDEAGWEGWTLIASTSKGVIRVNPAKGVSDSHSITYATPTSVQRLFTGPDSMYASGYLIGLAPFDEETGTPGDSLQSGQYESAVNRDGKLLLGAYGHAKLMEYDPATGAAPRQVYSLEDEGQDRPFGLAYDAETDSTYMGSVGAYGKNQGALTRYDFASGERTTYTTEIVTDQSVVSVLAHDGLVYIGTTIDGALAAPTSGQTQGHFIVWDPKTETVVRDLVPVEGDEGITGLIVGPDGLIWGVSEDTVFKYDPATEEIVYSEKLLRHRYGSGTVWAWANLAIGADGDVYGSNRFSFFRIDPETMAYTDIVPTTVTGSPLMNAVADADGDIFFSHGPYVFRYDVARGERACTVQLDKVVSGGLVVAGGDVVCGADVTIQGSVTVAEGSELRLERSTVRGGLTADGATAVSIIGSRISGATAITNARGPVVFVGNDVRGALMCGGNVAGVDDQGEPNAISGAVQGCSLK